MSPSVADRRQTVEGELEQGQASRLILQIGDDPFGEAGLELEAGAGGRFDNGQADAVGVEVELERDGPVR